MNVFKFGDRVRAIMKIGNRGVTGVIGTVINPRCLVGKIPTAALYQTILIEWDEDSDNFWSMSGTSYWWVAPREIELIESLTDRLVDAFKAGYKVPLPLSDVSSVIVSGVSKGPMIPIGKLSRDLVHQADRETYDNMLLGISSK